MEKSEWAILKRGFNLSHLFNHKCSSTYRRQAMRPIMMPNGDLSRPSVWDRVPRIEEVRHARRPGAPSTPPLTAPIVGDRRRTIGHRLIIPIERFRPDVGNVYSRRLITLLSTVPSHYELLLFVVKRAFLSPNRLIPVCLPK